MEEENHEILCYGCNKVIETKPWMSVDYPDDKIMFHVCDYLCSVKLHNKLGSGNYWDKIVNKEDFIGIDFLRPTIPIVKKKTYLSDVQIEVINEQKEFNKMESYWENNSDISSEDNFQ